MRRFAFAMVCAWAFAACVGSAAASTYTVSVGNFYYNPATLNILVGDTVHWVATGSYHTITSGTGNGDPNAGSLFDASITGSQTFDYTFTGVGVYPYFCRPHEFAAMKGTIVVQPPAAVAPRTWGAVKSLFVR
jgi:plastocyanin